MKTLIIATVFTLSSGVALAAPQLVAADDRIETQLCIDAGSDSLMRFHQAVKQSGISYRVMGAKLKCNDEPIATFAAMYNRDNRVAERLARYSDETIRTKVKITEIARLDGPLVISASR